MSEQDIVKAEKGKQAKAQNIADILAKKKPNIRTIDILLDSDLAAEIQQAERELSQAPNRRKSLADGSEKVKIQQRIDDLWDQAKDETVTFTFQDIGRRAFDDLVLQHMPTKAQRDRVTDLGGGILEYNIDTFPPALIAATAIDPKISEDEAQQIFDEWGSGDAEILFTQALLVCKERTALPKFRSGTEVTVSSD